MRDCSVRSVRREKTSWFVRRAHLGTALSRPCLCIRCTPRYTNRSESCDDARSVMLAVGGERNVVLRVGIQRIGAAWIGTQ